METKHTTPDTHQEEESKKILLSAALSLINPDDIPFNAELFDKNTVIERISQIRASAEQIEKGLQQKALRVSDETTVTSTKNPDNITSQILKQIGTILEDTGEYEPAFETSTTNSSLDITGTRRYRILKKATPVIDPEGNSWLPAFQIYTPTSASKQQDLRPTTSLIFKKIPADIHI